MTTPVSPIEPFTPFLASTYVVPNEGDRLSSFLGEELSAFSDVINDKKIGAYTQNSESVNGEKWIYATTSKIRGGYQIIAYIPSFVNQTVLIPIQNVNQQFVITHTWGSASLPPTSVGAGNGDFFSFMPRGDARIGYAMTDIAIPGDANFSGLKIVITTDGNRASYSGFIVVEYLHDGI